MKREELEKIVTEEINKIDPCPPLPLIKEDLLSVVLSSLEIVKLVMILEKRLNIGISEEEIEDTRTVGDLIEYLLIKLE